MHVSANRAITFLCSAVLLGCSSDDGTQQRVSLDSDPTSQEASSSSSSPAAYDDHGIRFEYPSDWIDTGLEAPEGAAWSVALGPPVEDPTAGAGMVEIIGYGPLTAEPTARQLKAFALAFSEFVQSEAMGEELNGPMKQVAVDGELAFEFWIDRIDPNGDVSWRKRGLVFAGERYVYALDCWLPDFPPDMEPGCAKVVESLEVT